MPSVFSERGKEKGSLCLIPLVSASGPAIYYGCPEMNERLGSKVWGRVLQSNIDVARLLVRSRVCLDL